MGWFGKPTPEEQQEARDRALLKAAKKGDTAAVEKLLAEGANIEAKSSFWENTPLLAAVWTGKTDTVRLLLDKGARLDAQNSIEYTALNAAVIFGYFDVAKLLLERGASLDIPDSGPRTPYDNAVNGKKTEFVKLIDHHKTLREAAKRERAERLAAEIMAGQRALAEKRAQEQAETERRAKKEHADVVIFTQHMGDLVLEDAFNFASLERLTFVRKGPGGDVQSMTRESFNEVNNQRLLRQAFEEHVKRGGTTPENEVFPEAKPRITRPPGVQP